MKFITAAKKWAVEKINGGVSKVGQALGIGGAVLTGQFIPASEAQAAVPAIVGTTISGIQTDALSIADLVWPFMLALMGIVILMKLTKRLINKA